IEGYWHELEVPYLEHGKPVRLEAFRFPATTNATVRVVSLDYQDIYSRGIRSKHLAGPEVWHGRLQCHYEQGVFSAEPVYEPPPRSAWNRIRFQLSGRHGERGNDGDT
ncbi:MAG: hypothetical protein IT304_08380, partial [Dehalococcoidia bacterium]|nr:hypothetical protein [Dehalococcoidia bacterium]